MWSWEWTGDVNEEGILYLLTC